jgi:hypothetical protein
VFLVSSREGPETSRLRWSAGPPLRGSTSDVES